MTPPDDVRPKTPREECEHAIRNVFASQIAVYYQKYPERLNDERSKQKLKMMLATMMDVLEVTRRFDLADRGGAPDDRRRPEPQA